MSRPTPLSGFPELLPAERNAELAVMEHLRQVFELHGYANIETRVVEPLDRLLSKGEIDKEIYVLRRLQADADASDAGVGLHYDLTVPFARYVLEYAGKLEFPFRRYQIQKAWRGERPQEGRFREFTQADIDVVGRDELPFHYDVEIARVISEALSGLPIPPLRLQVNNRKLIEGFYRGVGTPDPAETMRIIDKLDKVPAAGIATMLVDAGLTPHQASQCLALAEISTDDDGFVQRVHDLGVEHPLLQTGLDELAAVVEGCRPFANARFGVAADLRIARGLDYYTGTVFETRMDGFDSLGSICSGGRYDALASDGATTYPGVGISFGVSRTLVPLFARGLLTSTRVVPSAVLVAVVDEESRVASDAIAARLRRRGIATEVAAAAQKFGRQIRYADRRGIPYVWFPGRDGGSDEVRDIRSGVQVAADADTWRPDDNDLRPRVVDSLGSQTPSADLH
ncbi:MAG: histidyl-tRNA synthetase [Nocardioidaceae bacterium]|jgi:histidyl-tRNA synthetase|nr:histidyl-tRNA synthetase [Nocardioidaceae bacterium]